jgi:glycosyltransferase involved in cell wall biosynthesis
MRVALVGGRDGAHPEVAVETHVEYLAEALAARGDQVTIYTRRDGRRSRTAKGYRVADVRIGPVKPLASREALPFVAEFANSLDATWSADPPQVVHAHGWVPGLAAQLAARHGHLPVVQSFHGFAQQRAGVTTDAERGRLEPLLAKSATWVVAGCSAESGALAKLRHGRELLSILPDGVDVNRFRPAVPSRKKESQFRILYVGSNSVSLNEFEDIVRALPWVRRGQPMIAESHVADGSHDQVADVVRRVAADMKVSDRVRVLGVLPPRELPGVMSSADVVVWTPTSAPTASVALEAMASGVAVVATGVDAVADAIVHGVTGILIEPGKQRELVSALKMLDAQDFQRQALGAAGRARVRSRYTWDRIAADSQFIYHQIVGVGDQIDDTSPATG